MHSKYGITDGLYGLRWKIDAQQVWDYIWAIWAEVVNRCTASMGLQMGYMGWGGK